MLYSVQTFVGFLIQWLIQLVFFFFFFFEQCRQAKISYSGKITIDVCFQYNDGPIIRENVNFGQFPIMLQVCCFVLKFWLSYWMEFSIVSFLWCMTWGLYVALLELVAETNQVHDRFVFFCSCFKERIIDIDCYCKWIKMCCSIIFP